MLPKEDYLTGARLFPVSSIDLVIVNKKNELLLGKRKISPAKGFLFNPGGAILKTESFAQAWERICLREIGVKITQSEAKLIGIFRQDYHDNYGEDSSFPTVYHSHAFRIEVSDNFDFAHDHQHESLIWIQISELNDHPEVHKWVRAYFDENAENKWDLGK